MAQSERPRRTLSVDEEAPGDAADDMLLRLEVLCDTS